MEQNGTLHNSIVVIAGSDRLLALLARNRNGFNRQIASLDTPDDLRVSTEQRTKLLDAVIARNGSAAERIARTHIESAVKITIARLP